MTVDVLGPGWQQQTLALAPDGVGPMHARTSSAAPDPVATLVHPAEVGTRNRAVLYVHGFTDYFFQTHHADQWALHGYDFFAVDLRDYGRSIRPGRTPNWINDLAIYHEDLTAALAAVRSYCYEQVLIVAHSTGGLITPLYLDQHPYAADALILNSPWLDLNASWFNRTVTTTALDGFASLVPRLRVSRLQEPYGHSLHVSTGGEWDFDLAWKPISKVPVYAAWLRAIRRGQHTIAHGLDLALPILECTSARSGSPLHPSKNELDGADCVLAVADMHARGRMLGPDVTVAPIEGGRHDLALSQLPARRRYHRAIFDWLQRRGLTEAQSASAPA